MPIEERIFAEMLTEGLALRGSPLHHEDREAVAQLARHLRSGGAMLLEHARWLNRTTNIKGIPDYRYDCSACGHIFWFAGIESFKYCPNCGARMDLEDDYETD